MRQAVESIMELLAECHNFTRNLKGPVELVNSNTSAKVKPCFFFFIPAQGVCH